MIMKYMLKDKDIYIIYITALQTSCRIELALNYSTVKTYTLQIIQKKLFSR